MNATNRRFAMAGATAMLVAANIGIQVAGTGPAAAVTGIEKTTDTSVSDSQQTHTARAYCPAGKWVIGGGGRAFSALAVDSAKVTLVQLVPDHQASGTDSFVVTGSETTAAMTGNWWVEAYAICASSSGLSGYEVAHSDLSATASPPEVEAVAVCPGSKRVIGGGAQIANPGRDVSLQIVRASGPGDIFRATAHEDADGYSQNWTVEAYGICVNQPSGYEVVMTASLEDDSEAKKTAYAQCPAGKRVHGAGAAIADTAPGGVSLQQLYPYNALDEVQAVAVENTPVSQDWDFIVSQAICAF